MAHDFYEVVFRAYDTDNNLVIARATWEVGQSAGIKGVYKGLNGAGYMYPPTVYSDVDYGVASLFVGRKVDKTLLALGYMMMSADGWFIRSSTKSVTFEVSTLTTKLDIDALGAGTSFDNSPYNPSPIPMDAEKVSLGGVEYPYYKLPNSPSVITNYRFFTNNWIERGYVRAISKPDSSIAIEIIKREPRFLSGGQYYYVQAAKIDTGTTISFVEGSPFMGDRYNACFISHNYGGINFIFDTSESQGGIFSFTFRIPVYNLTREPSVDGTGFVTWYLQPSFGRDLFSLDNGVDAGGCILMGYNAEVGDMMDIFTAGMPW